MCQNFETTFLFVGFYVKKMERERAEKLKKKAELEKAEKEKAGKVNYTVKINRFIYGRCYVLILFHCLCWIFCGYG